MSRGLGAIFQPGLQWEAYQQSVELNQASPVQNTWYTVIDTTTWISVYFLSFNVQTANETLEFRLTIDGVVYTNSQAAVAGTEYWIDLNPYYIGATATDFNADTNIRMPCWYNPLICSSFKFELRKTTATGAGDLRGSIKYGVRN